MSLEPIYVNAEVQIENVPVAAEVSAESVSVAAELATEIAPAAEEYTGATEVTPSEEAQTLATRGKVVPENIQVDAIPSSYIIPSGTKSITANGTHDVRAFETAEVAIPAPESYTGAYIITPTASAQTLATANKLMTDNVTVLPASALPYEPFGKDTEFVKAYPTQTYALKDTAYNTWTPSTTQKVIVPSETLETLEYDLESYEYFMRFVCDAKLSYVSGTSYKAVIMRQVTAIYHYLAARPGDIAALSGREDNQPYWYAYTAGIMDCYNASGLRCPIENNTRGIFGVAASTMLTPTLITGSVEIKSPNIQARCLSSYFSTTSAGKVDKELSSVSLIGALYRCKRGSFARAIYDDVINQYNT